MKQKHLCDDGVIVFTGDLFHNKITLSPQSVKMAFDLLNNLTDIFPVIMIQGNHDSNYNNSQRLDSITPIHQALKNKNLFYITEQNYHLLYNNIDFFCVTENNATIVKDTCDNIKKGKISIGLYHGVINGCVLDNGVTMSSDKFNVQYFEDLFDYGLLGDIHKQQYLNKNKTIAYAGSLIQQNFGQSLNNHGVLKWDLLNGKSELIQIKNDYGFITLHVDSGQVLNNEIDIPSNPKIRMYVSDTDKTDIATIVHGLQKEYSVGKIITLQQDTNKQFKAIQLKENIQDIKEQHKGCNVFNVNYQNSLIKRFISNKYNDCSDQMITDIFKLNEQLNKNLPVIDGVSYNDQWKLLSISWDNMFRYGKDNLISFTNNSKNKINGIIGMNHSGKSSIIDVILYALFDKCSRSNLGNSIMNKRQKEFKCELKFQYDGCEYKIVRIGKRSGKKSVSVTVDFGFTNNDGEYTSLNGEDRNSTNKAIQSVIGCDYDMFISTFMSLQDTNGSSFIKQKQSERKQFINKIFNIDVYEQLHDMSKGIYNQSVGLYNESLSKLQKLDKQTYQKNISVAQERIEQITTNIDKFTVNIQKCNKAVELINSRIKPVDDSLIGFSVFNATNKINWCESQIIKNQELIDKNILQMKTITQSKEKLISKLSNFNKEELQQAQKNYKILSQQFIYINRDKTQLQSEIKSATSKNKILDSLQYDKDCKYCMNNPFVIDAIEAKNNIKSLTDKLMVINQKLSEMEIEKQKLSLKMEDNEKYNQLSSKLNAVQKMYNDVQRTNISYEKTISQHKQLIASLKTKIDKFNQMQSVIQENNQYKEKLLQVKQKIKTFNNQIKTLQRQMYSLQNAIKNNKQIITTIEQLSDNIIKLQYEMKFKKYYSEAVHKNGVPLLMLDEMLPMLQFKVNEMLSTITDFTLEFKIDDNKLNVYMQYTNEDTQLQVQLGSGFQKFISQLVIKIAISQLTNTNKSNFFVVDQGFGAMDSVNIGNLGQLFTMLKQKYEHVLLISHINTIHDYLDLRYDVYIDENGVSKITSSNI